MRMKKLRCSGKECKFDYFDDMEKEYSKCAEKEKVLNEEVKKMQGVLKSKRPRLK
jgi:hypothetical protein